MSSESYHEPYDVLSEGTKNMHRALVSVMEELEAIDWYQQRAEACSDPELTRILLHNKEEEIEHALMTLDWVRRHLPKMDELARQYLFPEGSNEDGGDESPRAPSEQTLGLGSLRQAAASEVES